MTIQTDAVSEVLHKVVEGREGYVYERVNGSCRYADTDGAPSCIVGHVVAALAPETYNALHEYEKRTSMSVAAGALAGWHGGTLDVEDRVIQALGAAQTVQDEGAPWGYARMAYDRVIDGADPWKTIEAMIERWQEEE